MSAYWRDLADGFLSAADTFSVTRYQINGKSPREWEEFKRTTSPGVRAIQSYSLRNKKHATGNGAELYFSFGSNGFMMGQGIGNIVMFCTLFTLPATMFAYSEIERGYEPRIRKHFQKFLAEMDSI